MRYGRTGGSGTSLRGVWQDCDSSLSGQRSVMTVTEVCHDRDSGLS